MKSLLLVVALVAVVVLSSCTSSRYAGRPASPYRYNGYRTNTHVDINRGYNNGHGNVYGGNSHGRVSRGHH